MYIRNVSIDLLHRAAFQKRKKLRKREEREKENSFIENNSKQRVNFTAGVRDLRPVYFFFFFAVQHPVINCVAPICFFFSLFLGGWGEG